MSGDSVDDVDDLEDCMNELEEARNELEETQEDLSAQIQENTQLGQQLDAAQQRILRLEGILTTGALALRGMN
jgi:predicted nuclease with TOPRIM domain